MVTEAKKRSNQKWDKTNLTVLGCKVRKDYADRVRQACADNGEAVNAVLKRALDAYLDAWESQDSKEED